MPDPADRPTRTRFVLVLWLCGLAGVLYLDRLCISQAVPFIQDELQLSHTQVSLVLMAFALAYGLFEVPTGRLGDLYGARAVLTRIVLWWSVFTALTGAAFGFGSLLVVRFLFGAGEAGAFPNVARVLSRWFPAGERGFVQGVLLAASQLGGVAAPVTAAYLIEAVGWRWAFVVLGQVGIFWALGFWLWFRNDPAEHPRVNAAELAVIRAGAADPAAHPGPIPWGRVAANRGIWVLGLVMTCSAFNSYLYYSWFTKYLMAARDVSNVRAGWLSALVLAGAGVGVLAGGVVAGRPSGARGRCALGVAGCLAAAGCLAVGARTDDPLALAGLAAASSLCVHLTLPTWWSAAIEQSGRHVGALFGLMNMMGVAGALASQWFVGAFSDYRQGLGYSGREQWDPMFQVYVGVLVAGACLWALYRRRPLEGDPTGHTTNGDGARPSSDPRGTANE